MVSKRTVSIVFLLESNLYVMTNGYQLYDLDIPIILQTELHPIVLQI